MPHFDRYVALENTVRREIPCNKVYKAGVIIQKFKTTRENILFHVFKSNIVPSYMGLYSLAIHKIIFSRMFYIWKHNFWFLNPFLHIYSFKHIEEKSCRKPLWEKVKLLKMSNFTFFHNAFYATCIVKSFNSHISVVLCSFFEFGTVSKWSIREWASQLPNNAQVPHGPVVKCLTRNPGVLGLSRTGSSGFFHGSVLGQETSEPSLVLVKPRKDMNNVSCRCDMTEILLKVAHNTIQS